MFRFPKKLEISSRDWNLEAAKVRYKYKSTSYNSVILAILTSAVHETFEVT
jgi:hypothetical protein